MPRCLFKFIWGNRGEDIDLGGRDLGNSSTKFA